MFTNNQKSAKMIFPLITPCCYRLFIRLKLLQQEPIIQLFLFTIFLLGQIGNGGIPPIKTVETGKDSKSLAVLCQPISQKSSFPPVAF